MSSSAFGLGLAALAGLSVACGSEGSSASAQASGAGAASASGSGGAQPAGSGGAAPNGTAANGSASTGGAGGTGGTGVGTAQGGAGGDTTTSFGIGGTACVGNEAAAEPVPLDLYIMLDKSASMNEVLQAPSSDPTIKTKWHAVKSALKAFFEDPQSKGMGAGLQFFPIPDPDAPASCTSNTDCQPEFGYCRLRACLNAKGNYCSTAADCPKTPQGADDECLDIGTCSNKPTAECLAGFACPGGGVCQTPLAKSVCVSTDSCDANDYAKPAVGIGKLNGAAPALVASMNGTSPFGLTPTQGALGGAIQHASAWALANPTHKVVAVLVTDGEPKSFACSVNDADGLQAISAAGLAGSPSVSTFAIGVLGQFETIGKDVLNQIALGGGTGSAIIIDPATDVKQAFIDALTAIRGTQLSCDFQVPPAPLGQSLKYDEVNVQHTPKGSSTPEVIAYVASAENCDPVKGGWYYDADPQKGGTPTKILVCESTCADLQDGGTVKFALGCETIHE